MNPLDALRSIQGPESTQLPLGGGQAAQADKGKGPSFQDILSDLVKEVHGLQQDADKSIEGLVTGETQDVHDVTTRMAEAGIAFDLMMEVRNKLLDAYQQILQMQA
jgi:flagellar hook-basal body complex protein FliE